MFSSSSLLSSRTFTFCLAYLLFPGLASAFESRHKVWPACRVELYSEPSIVLRTLQLKEEWIFQYSGYWESVKPILSAAGKRFLMSATKTPLHPEEYPVNPDGKDLWPLQGVSIHLTTNDTDLRQEVDESYELEVRPVIDNDGFILLSAPTVYGAMHGLQTLLQLIEFGWLDDQGHAIYVIKDTPIQIVDIPMYQYRGLMIDTSRHYLPVDLIRFNLDAMERNKLNVLHWHMTDSQSWPYHVDTYPELSEKGAYCSQCIYSRKDVQAIIDEAGKRGIRVVPEYDLPSHGLSIGASHPEFLTECFGKGPRGPLDVTKPEVYAFVHSLYDEIAEAFKDEWVHVGGDEVSLRCWANNTAVQNWMKDHNMTKEIQLLDFFESDLLTYVTKTLGKRPVVWQELLDSGLHLPPETVVDVWKDWDLSTREKATKQSYSVIFSACWYLDHLNEDWYAYYKCDPRDFNGTEAQKALVLGGHACMWGERVDKTNFLPRVWPRASAMAEKLWTGNSTDAFSSAQERLERFRCFMVRQGIPASPIAPGSCEHSFRTDNRHEQHLAATPAVQQT